jgi:putative membrane protein
VVDHPEAPPRLDVDVRFLLANERTLLAWIRTAVTIQAGGVALIQLVDDPPVLIAVGLGLLALGLVAGLVGYARYRAAGRAIQAGRLPAPGRGPLVLTVGVIAIAATLIVVYGLTRL